MSLRSRLRRLHQAQLDQVQVASACSARWEDMEGDEKVRFCRKCHLSVYNLSAMDLEEAAERVCSDDDRLCVRFYRRADGTVLTRDCPVGAESRRRRRREAVRDIGAFLVGAGFVSTFLVPVQGAVARPAARIAALRGAAKAGDMTALRKMLDSGVAPDARLGTGATALMLAAGAGHAAAVRLLLARGADVGATDDEGKTALQLAREGGHRRVVKLLQQAGATQ